MEHSGLQLGGDPIYDVKHVQAGKLFTSRHSENGPHGVGIQGFCTIGSTIGSER